MRASLRIRLLPLAALASLAGPALAAQQNPPPAETGAEHRYVDYTVKAGLKVFTGPTVSFEARGYLGQYLTVLTAPRSVAVRQIRHDSFQSEADNFIDFTRRVRELAAKP